jgi:drug/metabolite transporter (DMT)-like permease
VGVLLGGISSLLYGVGDFLGGEGAKRVSAPTVVLWAGVISFPLVVLVAGLFGGEVSAVDLWLGAAAGGTGAIGLVTLFAGLSRGQAAAVAPAAAAMSAVLPVSVAVIGGQVLTPLTWSGVAIAAPAIILCSWVSEPGATPFGGLWYGLAAGVGFGAYTVIIDLTDDASELLPLIPARASTMLVVLAVSLTGTWDLTSFRSTPRPVIVGNGVLDVTGNVALLAGLHAGSLAAVAVAASFYPAVTVVMARVVNAERLRGRQVTGLAMALAAVAAIAAG